MYVMNKRYNVKKKKYWVDLLKAACTLYKCVYRHRCQKCESRFLNSVLCNSAKPP